MLDIFVHTPLFEVAATDSENLAFRSANCCAVWKPPAMHDFDEGWTAVIWHAFVRFSLGCVIARVRLM